jgi:hypothetical protein
MGVLPKRKRSAELDVAKLATRNDVPMFGGPTLAERANRELDFHSRPLGDTVSEIKDADMFPRRRKSLECAGTNVPVEGVGRRNGNSRTVDKSLGPHGG